MALRALAGLFQHPEGRPIALHEGAATHLLADALHQGLDETLAGKAIDAGTNLFSGSGSSSDFCDDGNVSPAKFEDKNHEKAA